MSLIAHNFVKYSFKGDLRPGACFAARCTYFARCQSNDTCEMAGPKAAQACHHHLEICDDSFENKELRGSQGMKDGSNARIRGYPLSTMRSFQKFCAGLSGIMSCGMRR